MHVAIRNTPNPWIGERWATGLFNHITHTHSCKVIAKQEQKDVYQSIATCCSVLSRLYSVAGGTASRGPEPVLV